MLALAIARMTRADTTTRTQLAPFLERHCFDCYTGDTPGALPIGRIGSARLKGAGESVVTLEKVLPHWGRAVARHGIAGGSAKLPGRFHVGLWHE